MIHSILPPHLLEEQQNPLPRRTTRAIPGGYAEVWEDGSICRLISTDPGLYLDPRLAPGAQLGRGSGR